jgi:hypothetical protein
MEKASSVARGWVAGFVAYLVLLRPNVDDSTACTI